MVIVGGADPAPAIAAATRYFGGWTASPRAPRADTALPRPYTPPPLQRVFLLDAPRQSQADLTLRCTLPAVRPAERAALDVGVSALDGALFDALRVQAGATYHASAQPDVFDDGFTQLVVRARVQNDSVARAIAAALDRVRALSEDGLPEPQLRQQAFAAALSTVLELQTQGDVLSHVEGAVRIGAGAAYWSEQGARLAAITPAQVAARFAGCAEHYAVAIEGPIAVLEPQLRDARIAYEVVDWQARGLALLDAHDPKAAVKARQALESGDDDDE